MVTTTAQLLCHSSHFNVGSFTKEVFTLSSKDDFVYQYDAVLIEEHCENIEFEDKKQPYETAQPTFAVVV